MHLSRRYCIGVCLPPSSQELRGGWRAALGPLDDPQSPGTGVVEDPYLLGTHGWVVGWAGLTRYLNL
jgi:hypothetical protein